MCDPLVYTRCVIRVFHLILGEGVYLFKVPNIILIMWFLEPQPFLLFEGEV